MAASGPKEPILLVFPSLRREEGVGSGGFGGEALAFKGRVVQELSEAVAATAVVAWGSCQASGWFWVLIGSRSAAGAWRPGSLGRRRPRARRR